MLLLARLTSTDTFTFGPRRVSPGLKKSKWIASRDGYIANYLFGLLDMAGQVGSGQRWDGIRIAGEESVGPLFNEQ